MAAWQTVSIYKKEKVLCVVSVSITATGFNTGTSSKLVGIEFEVMDPGLVAST